MPNAALKVKQQKYVDEIINALRSKYLDEAQRRNKLSQDSFDNLKDRVDFIKVGTGLSTDEIRKKVEQIIQMLPDHFYDYPDKRLLDSQLIILEHINTHYQDFINENRFIKFFNDLYLELASFFKTITLADINPSLKDELSLIDPHALSLDILRKQFTSIGDLSKDMSGLKNFEENCKVYFKFLTIEIDRSFTNGSQIDRSDINKLQRNLTYINELIQLQSYTSYLIRNKGILSDDFIEAMSSYKIIDFIETREKIESTIIEALNGKEGDVILPNGLNARQEFALTMLSDIYKNPRNLNDLHKKFLSDFFEKSMGDMQLNKALEGLKLTESSKIEKVVTNFLKSWTYYTKNNDKFLQAYEKLDKNFRSSFDYDDSNSKVTLGEFGIIVKHAKLANKEFDQIYHQLRKSEIISHDSNLDKFLSIIKDADRLVRKINENILKEKFARNKTGDIFSVDFKKENEFGNTNMSIIDKLFESVSKHQHTGKFVQKKLENTANELSISHLTYDGPITDNLEMTYALTSDVYIIKLNKLINSNMIEKLKEKYFENYETVIDEMYRKIEYDIHINSQENFKEIIIREISGYIKIGLTSLLPVIGHKKIFEDDLNKQYLKVKEKTYTSEKHEMICSEFAARTTVAALIELDTKLKENLGITDKDMHVIKMPFSSRERFSTITPDRLIEILQKAGCIEKAERTATEQKYISSFER